MIFITLDMIKKHSPCESGWKKLLAHLGKTKADAVKFPLKTVLDSNGLDDALWCLRCLPKKYDKQIRLLACDFAGRVLYLYEKEYPDDKRPRMAIEAARKYANKQISKKELEAAGAAARDAAGAAAWDAAGAAARAARAAEAAAGDAAWVAGAAWDAGCAAGAAGDAEKQEQAKLLLNLLETTEK